MADYYVVPKAALDATADAVREKLGSEDSIEFTQNGFADAVEAIETGGGGVIEPDPLDVDFIDYDGTLVYTYTASDFLELSELPANPSHEGLVAQGWNWTLADAKEYVQSYGALVVGQNYTTDNGATRIYIDIKPSDDITKASVLLFYASEKGGVTVDWGDGTTVVTTANANALSSLSHVYSTYGQFVISIIVNSGTVSLGYIGSNQTLFYTGWTANWSARRPYKIEIGNGITGLNSQCFSSMNIESISIPSTLESIGSASNGMLFGNIYSLRGIVFPPGLNSNRTSVFSNNYSLRYVSFAKSFTEVNFNLRYSYKLEKLTLPDGQKNFPGYMLDQAQSLKHAIMPGEYTTIPSYAITGTVFVDEITIPATVTTIADRATQGLYGLKAVHLLPETPPALANTRAFDVAVTVGTVFYVPYSEDHSILEAYQSETNWSTFASQMQEEPQS